MKKWIIGLTTLLLSAGSFAQEKEVTALIETNMGNMKVKLYNDTPLHRDNFIRLAKAGHYDGTLFYRAIKNFIIQGGSSDSKNAIRGQAALAAPRQPNRENFFKESDISQFYIVQGRVYPEKELELIEKQVNIPIRRAIEKKYYTPEKKVILDTLRKQKKVAEFRAIANKIKEDIATDWELNTDKIYMPDDKREAYSTIGGVHHLDKEYTVFGEVIEGLEVIDKIAAIPTDKNDRPVNDVRIKVKILNE